MKTRTTTSILFIILFGVIGISLVACATRPSAMASPKTMTQMLQEAGFKAYPANTGEEMTHLRGCPKDTLMIHERPGGVCYAFADQATNSMYIGDEAAYQRLQSIMERQQQLFQEQRIKEDKEFWKTWGSRLPPLVVPPAPSINLRTNLETRGGELF
jgi:hypothetical protein